MTHLVNHIHRPEMRSGEVLHVVAVISNVEGYHSRYRLAREFIERMRDTPHVKLHVVEAAHGDRHHELDESANGLRLRIHSNAWIKENLINLGVKHLLPRDWKYMSWVDADVEFRDPNWALKTLHQLQHFPVLQPWQHAADLGPHGAIMQTHTSFGYLNQAEIRMQRHAGETGYKYGHSGYAWACTRAFWEQVGGLSEIAILGSADHHSAWACIGQVDSSIHRGMHPNYFRMWHDWQSRATPVTKKEVGFTVGRIEHHFHGSKANRRYRERWQILVENNYDPAVDIARDEQGVVHIVGKPQLEQAIRKYNRSRNEDSTDE